MILWAGSLLDWQDPQGLVRAVARLAQSRPRVKLVFMGTRHPNPDVPLQRAVEESIAVARETGVLDRHVFFNDWVPYAERHEWLLEADLGVTHAPRPPRDALRLPHADARLRLGEPAGGVHPRRRLRGPRRAGATGVDGRGGRRGRPGGGARPVAGRRGACGRSAPSACGGWRAGCAGAEVVGPLRRFCEAPWHAADRVPAKRAYRRRLEQKYRVSKWLKRTALRVGVSEGRIEQIKQVDLVRRALVWRNKLALARAQRGR